MADETIDIAPEGDLILLVGTGEDMVRLRVDSYMLRAASKPLKALLGPHFKEGHDVRNATTDKPGELALPEDHPKAMKMVCEALHPDDIEWPQNPGHDFIVGYANIADKYFLLKALGRTTELWFSKVFDSLITMSSTTIPKKHIFSWLSASVILDQPQAFEKATRFFLFHSIPADCGRLLSETCNDNPKKWQLAYHLAKTSSELRVAIAQKLDDVAARLDNHCATLCPSAEKHSYLSSLRRNALDVEKIHLQSVSEIIHLVTSLPKLKDHDYCRFPHKHGSVEYIQEMLNAIPNSLGTLKGLCLDCINHGQMRRSLECRYHPEQEILVY